MFGSQSGCRAVRLEVFKI